jgi:hypothetical protein
MRFGMARFEVVGILSGLGKGPQAFELLNSLNVHATRDHSSCGTASKALAITERNEARKRHQPPMRPIDLSTASTGGW